MVRRIWLVGVKIDIVAAHRRWVQGTKANPRRRPEDHPRLAVMTQRRADRPLPAPTAATIHPVILLRRRQMSQKPGKKKRATTPAHYPSLDTWDFSSPLMSLWMNRFYVYLGFAFGISLWICFQIVIRKQLFIFKDKNSQKSVPKATGDLMTNGYIPLQKKEVFVSGVKIFYGSQTGTAKGFATSLAEAVTSLDLPVAVINLKEYDPDDHLVEEVGKNVDKWLWMLGAHRVATRGEGDCDVAKSKHGSIEADFRAWKTKFLARLQTLQKGEKKPCDGNCKRGQCESSAEEEPFESTSEEESGTEDHQNLNSVVDVEDLGKIMNYVKKEKLTLLPGSPVIASLETLSMASPDLVPCTDQVYSDVGLHLRPPLTCTPLRSHGNTPEFFILGGQADSYPAAVLTC
ncbi:hypothetical protein GH733_018082 [Mirounga leonina]|nr:hypothetical protein GH733_018082 [Mirounga leonina]